MIIRKAMYHDLSALSVLYQQLMGKPSDERKMADVIQKILKDEHYYLLVAEDDDNHVVGTVMGIVCYDLVEACDPFMLVENVIVSERQREAGVGKQLFQALEKIARAQRCTYLMLVSGLERTGAHHFYQQLGYEEKKGFKKML